MYECPACNGDGCDECRHGHIELATCPIAYVTEEVWQVIQIAGFFNNKGLAPVSGGVLDQAQVFLDAAAFIATEEATWSASLGLTGWGL